MLRYFFWVIIAGFVLSCYVWQQTQAVRLSYTVAGLRRDCERMEQENRGCRHRLNCLRSLERLDKVAKDNSLINPDGKNIIYLQ